MADPARDMSVLAEVAQRAHRAPPDVLSPLDRFSSYVESGGPPANPWDLLVAMNPSLVPPEWRFSSPAVLNSDFAAGYNQGADAQGVAVRLCRSLLVEKLSRLLRDRLDALWRSEALAREPTPIYDALAAEHRSRSESGTVFYRLAGRLTVTRDMFSVPPATQRTIKPFRG